MGSVINMDAVFTVSANVAAKAAMDAAKRYYTTIRPICIMHRLSPDVRDQLLVDSAKNTASTIWKLSGVNDESYTHLESVRPSGASARKALRGVFIREVARLEAGL